MSEKTLNKRVFDEKKKKLSYSAVCEDNSVNRTKR